MAKKGSNTLLIILVLGGILIFGGTQGWFKSITNSTVNNNQIPNPSNVQNQFSSYQNGLWFSPTTICVGGSSTGNIDTNIPNGKCTIFINNNGVWNVMKSITLNANGGYSESQTVNVAGTATFNAVCCDSQQNCKISNQASLTVNDCSTPAPSSTPPAGGCSDSDRFDDSDLQPTIFGYCQSSVTTTGIEDVCASLTSVSEKYCGTDNTCKSQTISCLPGWQCIEGQCRIPRCVDVIFPTSQASCDIASSDESGPCIFAPATLTMPARCYLGV